MALARRASLRLRVPAALRECLRASLAQRRSDAERKPTGLGSWTRDERRGAVLLQSELENRPIGVKYTAGAMWSRFP